jgi:hypothetical protein
MSKGLKIMSLGVINHGMSLSVLYMHIWHLRIRASSLQFLASKINMALARMDKLVKKLMSNPGQLQWLLLPMEVSKLQHPTKNSLTL